MKKQASGRGTHLEAKQKRGAAQGSGEMSTEKRGEMASRCKTREGPKTRPNEKRIVTARAKVDGSTGAKCIASGMQW